MCGNSHTPSCIPNYIPHTAIIIVFIITSIHVQSLKNDWGKHLELLFWIVIWFHVRAWGGDRPYIFRLSLFRPGVSCEPGMAQKPPYQQLVKTARPPYTHNNRRWFSWNWTQMSLKKKKELDIYKTKGIQSTSIFLSFFGLLSEAPIWLKYIFQC